MQNHYSINVARKAKTSGAQYQFFATRPDSILSKHTAAELFDEISKRFPEREGFQVTITYWQAGGTDMTEEFRNVISLESQEEVTAALAKL
jgi:ribosomal protein L17